MEPKIKETRWSREFEQEVYEHWKKTNAYAFKKPFKKIYSIDTPPPYVNAPVHIGQVATYVMMDMFARYKRMTGHSVIFPLGLDKNGLPIEMAAEKKYGVKLTSLSRERALELCKKVLDEATLASVESFLRCGISFNSWKLGKGIGEVYETDSNDYRALTQETFIMLWNKGLIYEDTRINNWCPGCQTTLADAEVIYEDVESSFNNVAFKVKETGEEIIIGTTRPELMCTCGMIIFNPEDERYKHLAGKHAITPLFNKPVPIKAHPAAEKEKCTGLVMMCSAGDLSDIRFFREMGLKPVIAINKDGTMNEHAGFLKSLSVRSARQKMIEMLKEKGLLKSQKTTVHRTPVCERSKDEIEFIEMTEYYVKQLPFKKKMKELAKKIRFFNDKSRQLLLDWIDGVSIDWPISRRRYYATEVPVWYCVKCKSAIVPKIGKKPVYYRPWKEKCTVKQCPNCKCQDFKGDERVFDTWFDSSNTPLYILKWNRDSAFFKKAMPCSLRPQGKEIVRTWLYYTLLKVYQLTGKTAFKDSWINYHIVDEQGRRMSKSTGNVIDPKDVLDRFGAEPFRLWAAVEGNLTETDFRCSFERIEGAGKSITKLFNVARFISMFEKPKKKPRLLDIDVWILSEINKIAKQSGECYERYDFHNPAIQLRHFLWETFASHYLELVKGRAYNQEGRFSREEQDSARFALHECLEIMLKLLAPINPMITYHIYRQLTGKEVHSESFPLPQKISSKIKTEDIAAANSAIWKAKKDAGKSLREAVKKAVLPASLRKAEKDFASCHNIQTIEYGGEIKVVL